MARASAESSPNGPASQTLDRGLRVLDYVAAAGRAVTTADVEIGTGLHRSITYRMLRTLEARHLVSRDVSGAWRPGTGLAVLASAVAPEIREAADGVLGRLADDCGMTAFLTIRDVEEVVTVSVVEPTSSAAYVTHRPGRRYPVTRGAPGLAMLAAAGTVAGERTEVAIARRRGWAHTEAEVVPGVQAVSAPVHGTDGDCNASISVLFVGDPDVAGIGSRVIAAAQLLEERLRQRQGERSVERRGS